MSETTPRPWQLLKPHQIGNWAIAATDDRVTMIAEMLGGHRHEGVEAEARLIVRAVNAFEPMRDALRRARPCLGSVTLPQARGLTKLRADIDAALALAEQD